MTKENGAFYERLAERGVTRRDFLKYCGGLAAMLGVSQSVAATIAPAIANAADSGLTPALWLNGGACTGCTESMAQSTSPNVADVVLDILSMNYMETVMFATGHAADEAMYATAEEHEGNFVLIYEGSVMEGWNGNALRIAGEPSTHQIDEIAPKAAACVAVGSCAVDGGWVKGAPNPAEATGIQDYFTKKGIKTPVINLPGCPVNPEHIVAVVVDAVLLGTLADGSILNKLDKWGRPKYIFHATIHDSCPRRGHFENGEFVYEFGSEEEKKEYCLYAVGCKGPQTYNNCPTDRWNDKQSWCVEAGAPCIGCATYNWVDENTPFLNRFRRIALGEDGKSLPPTTIPAVATAAIAGVFVVHGFGMWKAGRVGNGAPTEDMKDWDRKRLAKKGGE